MPHRSASGFWSRPVLLLALWGAIAAAVAAGEPPPIVVSGTVTQGGEPVVEAAVSVLQFEEYPDDYGERVAGGVSEADGGFRVVVPWSGALSRSTWSIAVEAPDRAPDLAPGIVDLGYEIGRLGPGDRIDVGGVALTAGCAVVGSIHAASGEEVEPVREVEVALWREGFFRLWRTATDGTGRFCITGLIPGDYVLGAAHPDWAATRRDYAIDCAAAVTELAPVRLAAPTEMRVRVLLEDGRPAAGASFSSLPLPPGRSAENWLTPTSGRADSEGRFTVGVGLESSPWLLELRAPGWVPRGVRFPQSMPVPEEPRSLTLRTPRRIEGAVHDFFGDAIEAAAVAIFVDAEREADGAPSVPPVALVVTSDEGAFDSGPLEPGAYALGVAAPGYVKAERRVAIPGDGLLPVRVEIELEGENLVTGRFEVVSFDGRPVAGAAVDVIPYDWDGPWIPSCYTGPQGRCAIAGIPADQPVRVTAARADYDAVRELLARIDPESVATLSFAEPHWGTVTVRGRVVRALDGEAVSGARVEVTEHLIHAGYPRTTSTNRDGAFVLYDVPEGAYALRVSAPQAASLVKGLKVVAGMEPLAVRLTKGATVTGELLGAGRENEAREPGYVRVKRAEDHGPPGPCDEIRIPWVEGFPPPADGVLAGTTYRVERLPPGRWALVASLGRRTWSRELLVEEGDELLRLDLEPEAGCEPADPSAEPPAAGMAGETPDLGQPERGPRNYELEYSFVHASGIPLRDDLDVQLIDAGGAAVADSSWADASGVWADLPRGSFTLRLDWMGRKEAWPVTIPGPARRFVIAPGGDLRLWVIDAELAYNEREDWSRAIDVELTPIGHGGEVAPIAARGRIYFYGLPLGWWQVDVTSPTGEWTELVEIKDGGTHTLVLP